MIMQSHISRKERGFTLTEAAIVLGIVGLILGAIWVAAASVYANLRVKQTSEQLLQLAQGIRSIYATSVTVDAGVTALTLAQAGVVPKDMLDNPVVPTTVTDIWGGAVTVAAATTTVANDSFTITFANVPVDACANLLVRNTGQGRDTGLTVALANAKAVAIPVTVALATAGCVANGTVGFTFRLRA